MLDAIQAIRDVVIILSGILITATVMLVGRAILGLARRAEDMRLVAIDIVSGVANPIKGIGLAVGRITRGHKTR